MLKYQKRPGIRKGGGLPPFGGSGNEGALNTTFEEPKLTLFCFYKTASSTVIASRTETFTVRSFKISPLIRTVLNL